MNLRHLYLLAILSLLCGCTSTTNDPIVPPPTPPAQKVDVTLPAAKPFAVGEAITIEETVSIDQEIQTGGMRGDARRTSASDRTSKWTARLLRSGRLSFFDFTGEETVRDGADRKADRTPTATSEPREIILAGMANPAAIRGVAGPTGADSALTTAFASKFNLASMIEAEVGGKHHASETAPLPVPLVEALFVAPYRTPPGELQGSARTPATWEGTYLLSALSGGAATFEFTAGRRSEAFLGKLETTMRGRFIVTVATSRVTTVEIDSTHHLDENRFYESVSISTTARARLAFSSGRFADAPGPYELGCTPRPGDRVRVQRFWSTPAVNTPSEPASEFVQEYAGSADALTARRRYVRASGEAAALEGATFELKLDPTGFADNPAAVELLGKDDRLFAWLPAKAVRVGDFWTLDGMLPADQPLPETAPAATLLAVRPAPSTKRPQAFVAILNLMSVPWDGVRKADILILTIDLTDRRLVSVTTPNGAPYVRYTRVGTINWKEPTATERVIAQLRAEFNRIKKRFDAERDDEALAMLPSLVYGLCNLAAHFEPELEYLLGKVRDAQSADLMQTIAITLFERKQSPAHLRTVLEAQFLNRQWKNLTKNAELFAKLFPDRPEGLLYQSIPLMNLRKFDDALPLLEKAMGKVDESADDGAWLKAMIELWTARATLNKGDFAKAHSLLDAALDAAPRGSALRTDILELLSDVMKAEKMKVYVSFNAPEYLPLGTYHLMSERNGPLPPFLNLHLINGSDEDRVLVFSAEVQDVTYVSVDQVLLPGRPKDATGPARFNMRIYQTPPLRKDFNVNSILEEIERPIRIILREKTDTGERILLEQTIPVTLWPRKRVILQKLDADVTGDVINMEKALAAWVTPRSPFVEKFINDAKKTLPKGVEFLGGAGIAGFPAKDQVRAMYDYLKSRGVSYVAHTHGTTKTCFYQDVRLPSEVYRNSNSLCLEGTVLFATLMEGIGLKPVIVLVPGHAFVGWRDPGGPVDSKLGRFFVLETTSIGRHDFEFALKFAEQEFEQHRRQLENPTHWGTQVLDVEELRRLGYKPQPYPED